MAVSGTWLTSAKRPSACSLDDQRLTELPKIAVEALICQNRMQLISPRLRPQNPILPCASSSLGPASTICMLLISAPG